MRKTNPFTKLRFKPQVSAAFASVSILIDADLVGPETPWSIQLSKPSQSIVEAGSEPNALAVADDLVAAVRLAPHVRE